MSHTPSPLRLRPAIGEAIGTTAFFRNRCLFDTLLDELAASGLQRVDVLFHACSIGAEVVSLVVQYLARGLDSQFDLRCHATDKQADFIAFARGGRYPLEVAQGCSADELRWFAQSDDALCPLPAVSERISWLAASDFISFKTDQQFDVVCLLNAFVYVPAALQASALDAIAGYNRQWLVTTGFHQDSIKADLCRNHYAPILRNQEAIHNGWTDRLRPQPLTQAELPAHIHTDWSLRPFAAIPDHEYRYCALFRKASSLR